MTDPETFRSIGESLRAMPSWIILAIGAVVVAAVFVATL